MPFPAGSGGSGRQPTEKTEVLVIGGRAHTHNAKPFPLILGQRSAAPGAVDRGPEEPERRR